MRRPLLCPDALGCFTRTYDRAHFAQHPDQLVTAVKLRIHRPPEKNSSKYWFLAQFKLRGRDETLRTSGICNEKTSGLRCFVECDGGGVDVVPRARDTMMYLDRISEDMLLVRRQLGEICHASPLRAPIVGVLDSNSHPPIVVIVLPLFA